MRIPKTEDEKNSLKQKFKPYFCPNCKVLFDDKFNSFQKNDNKSYKEFEFYCSECNEPFSENTYKGKTIYKISESCNESIDAPSLVKLKIEQLHNEGFSQREIMRLTKFQKSLIEKYTKLPEIEILSINLDVFKEEYLKTTKEMTLEEKIVCAINFGCTMEQIRKLFQIGNDRISTIRKVYCNQQILHKNKIVIDNDNVKIYKLSE